VADQLKLHATLSFIYMSYHSCTLYYLKYTYRVIYMSNVKRWM